MTELIMPKMGDGMEEGTLVEWANKEGDTVKSGQVIGSIQTDKATLELEAPASGTLAGLLIKAGDTVPVGQPIGLILKAGESVPAGWGKSGGAASAAAKESAQPASEKASESESATSAPAAANGGRIKASPLARKTAAEKGVDIASIVGSGPGGRIVQADVLAAKASQAASSAPVRSTPVQPAPLPSAAPTAADVVIPLSRLKKITGERTLASKLSAPHIYVTVEVDIERIIELRASFDRDGAAKPSINDFVLRASALALREMPLANSSITAEGLLQHGEINIGIAAAVDSGLTVPVLKNVDQLSLGRIATGSKELVAKARENRLSLDELSGSTFSVSNMGMLDIDNFCAIINTPNAVILAISSARKKVVVNDDDELVVTQRMNITGSFDHRVLDGAEAARFMNIVKTYLQNPTRLLG